MSKKFPLLAVALCSALLMAACSTDEKSDEKTKETPVETVEKETTTDPKTEEKETEDTNEAVEEQEENTAAEQKETTPETDKESSEDPKQTEGTTSHEGDDVTQTGSGAASPQLPYKIDLKENYSLTVLEPGQDVIMPTNDPKHRMALNVWTTDENTFEKAKEDAAGYAGAIGDKKDLTADQLAPLSGDVAGYQIESEGEFVYVIAFQQNDLVSQLIIYDDANSSNLPTFLNMAATISKK